MNKKIKPSKIFQECFSNADTETIFSGGTRSNKRMYEYLKEYKEAMNKKPYKKYENVEHPQPQRRVKLEVYDDGLYVGTIPTDFYWDDKHIVAEETLMEYAHKAVPTRKKKYLSVKIV